MIIFELLMKINPIWKRRYERLLYDDKDKIMTVFGVAESGILYFILFIIIVTKFW